jgi:alpha-amylase
MDRRTRTSSHPPTRRRRRLWTLLAAGVLVLAGAVPLTLSSLAQADPGSGSSGNRATHDVLANLFEWNWPSVAKECTTVLGPKGYGGVQVAPPQDSVKRTETGNGSDTILHPWWEVYQPVDYNLTSRMGNEAQFQDMVATCRKAGVKVYVDAVINHMTGQGHVSYGGVDYTPYNYPDYPGTQKEKFFHVPAGECPSSDGGIQDFNNLQQVFHCNLLGLEDLRTQTDYVESKLAGYLNKLIGYGVSGFRVDAGKHIGQDDLTAIYSRLHNTRDGQRPYWVLEVFGGGPGLLSPQAFTTAGSVLGLDGVKQLRDAFKSYPAEHVGSIATLRAYGEESGLTPSSKTLAFVQNHDTERNGDALNYKDGARNILANEFILAFNYGTPQVYAGFAFGDDTNQSPPSTDDGMITNTDCSGANPTWICIDRNQGVADLVGWHNYVGNAAITNWWDDQANLIAFSRGNKGWISINNGPAAQTRSFATGLPRGVYCDVISSASFGHGTCSGTTVTVNSHGIATVTVPSLGSVAIYGGSRIG